MPQFAYKAVCNVVYARTRLTPDMIGWLVEVGKSSLNAPQTLEDATKQYKQEEENRLTVLATMVEPLLMFSVGIMIALLVVALYLPIFKMRARRK